MKKNHSSHRFQQLVAGFAASAFALLGMLAFEQHTANTVSASVAERATVMTNYRSSANCIVLKGKRVSQSNYRICRPIQK
jgi:hypothetical protein